MGKVALVTGNLVPGRTWLLFGFNSRVFLTFTSSCPCVSLVLLKGKLTRRATSNGVKLFESEQQYLSLKIRSAWKLMTAAMDRKRNVAVNNKMTDRIQFFTNNA